MDVGGPPARWGAGIAAALAVTVTVALILAACGRLGFKSGSNFSKRVVELGQPVPKGGGVYKVGSPYQIDGEWFYPREDAHYDRVGVASWYGELFHGRYTANGEIYDMNALTAAHPTLPLPIYAKVTNLANGRSLVVRVNDRGPYAHNRVIDMSKRSAELLGFRRNGTTQVRVTYLKRAPLSGDDTYERQVLASQPWARMAGLTGPPRSSAAPAWKPLAKNEDKAKAVTVAAAAPVMPPSETATDARDAENGAGQRRDQAAAAAARDKAEGRTAAARQGTMQAASLQADPVVTSSVSGVTRDEVPEAGAENTAPRVRQRQIYVQSGAFKLRSNAERLRDRLAAFGRVEISPATVNGTVYHRVRLGPFKARDLADETLRQVVQAGASGASIVGD